MEEKAKKRSREFLAAKDKSEELAKAPKVEQKNKGKLLSTSTMTSMNTSLGVSATKASQSIEQQLQQIR